MDTFTLEGGKHAVLLLHDLQGNPGQLQPFARRLNQAGFTVHAPHIKGYGFLPGDTSHSISHWQEWHQHALNAFKAFKSTHASVSIGGLGTGATLALSIAAELGDDVSALALLSITLKYD